VGSSGILPAATRSPGIASEHYTYKQRSNSRPYLSSSRTVARPRVELKIEALRAGTLVAIPWDVTKGRRKTSVWWSAVIISIASRSAKSRSATVQYEAQHEYKNTASKVCFNTGREFVTIESGGKLLQHLWRCVDTSSSQMGGASSI
jgi:hypothetical protein